MQDGRSAGPPARRPLARGRWSGAAALAASCLLGAARAAGASDACSWGDACPPAQPECSCATFVDEVAHYRLRFVEPLVRLPLPAQDGEGAAAGQARRASFASADGRFRLEAWGLPGRVGASDPSPAARLRQLARPGEAGTGEAGTGEAGWRVTYRAAGASWAVASGYTPAGHVFYERIDHMCAGAAVTGFVAVWPSDRASRARFDHWIEGLRVGSYRC